MWKNLCFSKDFRCLVPIKKKVQLRLHDLKRGIPVNKNLIYCFKMKSLMLASDFTRHYVNMQVHKPKKPRGPGQETQGM